jgi:pyruvate formate lyase activating enzyme
MPAIKGFIETSFVDWKGHLASVLFTGGCNFRCPFLPQSRPRSQPGGARRRPDEYIVATIRKYRAQWVDRIVVTRGEPTIHKEPVQAYGSLEKRRNEGQLDTNGSTPLL